MAQKHESPLKAIRRQCLECCCNSSNEVKLCISLSCYLWPYRFGVSPATAARQGKLVDPKQAAAIADTGSSGKLRPALYRKDGGFIFPVPAIRLHCLDYVEISEDVRECAAPWCPLWPWRFRSRPSTAAARGELVEPTESPFWDSEYNPSR